VAHGDHDDADALVLGRGHEQLHDLVSGDRVERAGGLVGEDQARPGDQRAGDRGALALPAGKLAR
jgi:hypothetical protein